MYPNNRHRKGQTWHLPSPCAKFSSRAQSRSSSTRRCGKPRFPGRRDFIRPAHALTRAAALLPGSAVVSARVLAVIPARFGATRFPGKPLQLLWGKPMLQHVWERAAEAGGIDRLVIATDDERIATAVRSF